MPQYIYKVVFEDGASYNGGPSIHDSHWKDIPDKPIKRLEYFLFNGEGIILENFESYLCFVEAMPDISRKVGNCPVCGKQGKISKRITKYDNGSISKEFLARCKDMGKISSKNVIDLGEDWNNFANKIIKNKFGEIIDDDTIWLTYSESQLPYINNLFNVNIKKLIKEAFNKSCKWVGKIQDLKYPIDRGNDKYIYIMGLKNNFVTSYRVSLDGKSGEDKYHIGDITRRILPFGQEYLDRPTNPNFWKKGIING